MNSSFVEALDTSNLNSFEGSSSQYASDLSMIEPRNMKSALKDSEVQTEDDGT